MNHQGDSSQQHYYLRPLSTEELGHISEWYENLEELSLIESRLPAPPSARSLEEVWQNELVSAEPRTSYLFSLHGDDGNAVGHTGLQDINHPHGNAVVFVFVRKDMRRRGLALRSLALMLDLAFFQLRLHRMTTYVHSNNYPSVALIERLGFLDEGCMREGCFFDGKFHDVKVVGMLTDEWRSVRGPLNAALDSRTLVTLGRDAAGAWGWPRVQQ